MAISSYPTPSDAGVLCIILANTAISISIFKEIFRSILHVIGIHIASWDEFSIEHTDPNPAESRLSPSKAYMDAFRDQTPAEPYDSIFTCKQDCSICLVEFEPESEINHLSCGHVFHASCLEKWLNYWNTTCPLCRNYLIPHEIDEEEEEEFNACPIPM